MIIIDTREQKPLWDESKFKILRQKLDEGDYTTEDLLDKAHAERKSGIDLYGSLIQNHKRFSAEIQRAIEKDLSFAIFVECSEKKFIAKGFKGGSRLQCPSETLGKIIKTFTSRYPIEIIWCKNRDEMKDKICLWFANQMEELGITSNSSGTGVEDSIELKIDGNDFIAEQRTFSTGKEGYGFYGKFEIDGRMHQVSFNAIDLEN